MLLSASVKRFSVSGMRVCGIDLEASLLAFIMTQISLVLNPIIKVTKVYLVFFWFVLILNAEPTVRTWLPYLVTSQTLSMDKAGASKYLIIVVETCYVMILNASLYYIIFPMNLHIEIHEPSNT